MTTEIQEGINISVEDIQEEGRKMSNWKATGPDHVQRFLFKKWSQYTQNFKNSSKKECDMVMYENGWLNAGQCWYRKT